MNSFSAQIRVSIKYCKYTYHCFGINFCQCCKWVTGWTFFSLITHNVWVFLFCIECIWMWMWIMDVSIKCVTSCANDMLIHRQVFFCFFIKAKFNFQLPHILCGTCFNLCVCVCLLFLEILLFAWFAQLIASHHHHYYYYYVAIAYSAIQYCGSIRLFIVNHKRSSHNYFLFGNFFFVYQQQQLLMVYGFPWLVGTWKHLFISFCIIYRIAIWNSYTIENISFDSGIPNWLSNSQFSLCFLIILSPPPLPVVQS